LKVYVMDVLKQRKRGVEGVKEKGQEKIVEV
jgi:hypothetical protein